MKEKLTRAEKAMMKAIKEAEAAGAKPVRASKAPQYGEWARAQRKDERLTIRIDGQTLAGLKAAAVKKGKKYQTYIGEILVREAKRAA